MRRLPLSVLPLLGATGCTLFTDPLIGDWEVTDAGGYLSEYRDVGGRMEIEDDYTGFLELEFSGGTGSGSYDELYEFDLEAEAKDDGDYTIELDGGGGKFEMECAFDDAELECELEDGGRLSFEKDE